MKTTLSKRIASGEPLLAPGAYDALSALLIEQAGFDAIYLSGASISYTQLGRPDIGLTSFDEVAAVVGRIRERTTLPLIVDADTGFGSALNVQRTVRIFERMGASAIQIEDQIFPKRCGHLAGKALVSDSEMAAKIQAACDARKSEETLIIARTDAIAVEGFEASLDRSEAYLAAGADILFIEAPRTIVEMDKIVARFGRRVPLLANMVEGGTTPIRSLDDLSDSGFSIVIAPGAMVRAYVHMVTQFLSGLKQTGSTLGQSDKMVDFAELNARLGMAELASAGASYDPSLRLDVYRANVG
jgi:2-methylisocitrate lyase-like PEP mutase family enzyme